MLSVRHSEPFCICVTPKIKLTVTDLLHPYIHLSRTTIRNNSLPANLVDLWSISPQNYVHNNSFIVHDKDVAR